MPALVPLGAHTGKPPIPLKRPVMVVGSRSNAHLHLLSSKVSKAHALIINSDGKIYIRDLASRTHIYVNKKQVREADLNHGDQIQIGSFLFKLAIPPSWVVNVRQSKAKAAQLEVAGTHPIRIDERVILIGRRPTCDISLLEDSASTAHAVIIEMGGKRFIRDLGSRTGTFINGRSVHQEQINFGDVIRIGETELRYAPASEIPTGPLPVDPNDPDFDELEDLVGTAPLMEEPPEVIAKRLEQEIAERQEAAAPPAAAEQVSARAPQPVDSAAPIPLELDDSLSAHVPPTETSPAESAVQDSSVQDSAPAAEPPTPPAEEEPLPLAGERLELDVEDETPQPAPASVEEEDLLPVEEAPAAEQTPAAAESPAEEAAGVEALELLPAGDGELDLTQDLELEAPADVDDPEATRALPPEHKPRPKAPPVISERVVEVPAVDEVTLPADELVEPAIEDSNVPLAEEVAPASAGDTVTLVTDAAGPLADDQAEDSAATAEQEDADTLDLAPERPADEALPVEHPAVEQVDTDDATAEAPAADEPVAEVPLDEPPTAESAAEPTAPAKPKKARKPRKKKASRRKPEVDAAAAAAQAMEAEVVESTEPTPESAQALEPVVDDAAAPAEISDDLTDTGFDREVRAFAESSPEPIVEELLPEASPADEPEIEPAGQPEAQDVAEVDAEPQADSASDIELALDSDSAPLPPIEPALEIETAGDDEIAVEEAVIEPVVDDASTAAEAPAPGSDDSALQVPASDDSQFAALDLDAEEPASADTAGDLEDEFIEPAHVASVETVETMLPPADEAEVDIGTDELLAAEPTVPVEQQQSPATEAEVGDFELPSLSGAEAGAPVTTETPVPTAEIEEDSPTTAEDTAPPAAEAPSPAPGESFEPGVNQWGFLGGAPLNLSPASSKPRRPAAGLGATPPPAKGIAFGRRPLAPEQALQPDFDAVDDSGDAFAAGFTGPLPEIREVDVFSQLGAPPEDDPLFGRAASLGLTQNIPPATPSTGAEDTASSETGDDPHGWTHDSHEMDDLVAPADAQSGDRPAEDEPLLDDDFTIEPSEAEAATPMPAQPLEESSDEAQPAEAQAERGRKPVRPMRTPVAFQPSEPPKKKKRRWFFSVPFLLALMLLVMGAAVAAIWVGVPVAGRVEGWLVFDNMPEDLGARHTFFEDQRRYLNDTETRERSTRALAIANLQQAYPGVDPGFLADPVRYAKMVDSAHRLWLERRDGRLLIQLDSDQPHQDSRRMHALLVAMFQQNQRLVDHQRNAEQELRDRIEALNQKKGQIEALQQRHEVLKRQSVPPYTEGELKARAAQVATLEARWRQAEEAVRKVQGEIERMREAAARIEPSGDAGDPQVAISDESLKRLEQQAAELQQRLDAERVADALAASHAQKLLDESIAGLEAQLEQVMKQMKDVPELRGYVTVAKLLQDTVHRLTTELLHDQKQQLETITELKRKLDEQLIARRNEVWANDPDLKNYTALLEMQRRMRNAAVASKDHPRAREQVAELDAAIAKLEEQIAERREVLGNDQIYAEAIAGLQGLITHSEKRLAESEKRIEQDLAGIQRALADAAPNLEQLPEDQKKLAAELERRIVAMQSARKQYLQTLSSGNNDSAESRRKLEAELLALQTQMDAKRQELLAERRKTLSDQERAELLKQEQAKAQERTRLEEAAKLARDAFRTATQELAAWEAAVQQAALARVELGQVAADLLTLDREQADLAREVEKLRAAAKVVVPQQPKPENVITQDVQDQRSWYALVAVSTIALLFGVLMMVSHQAHARVVAAETTLSDETEPPLFPTSHDFPEEILPADPSEPPAPRLREPSTA